MLRKMDKEERRELVRSMVNPEGQEAPEDLKLTVEDQNLKGESKLINWIINISTVVGIVAMVVFVVWAQRQGIFKSQESLQNFVDGLYPWGPVVFTIIQIIQVVIPIIPGGISTAVGVILFGPLWGFVYNYVGIAIGSIAVFFLSRRYGKPLVSMMIGKKRYNKYIGWTGTGQSFTKIFAILIFLPVAPDDILCYIAGLTHMTAKEFVIIILTCKPPSILAYSMGLTYLLQQVLGFLKNVA